MEGSQGAGLDWVRAGSVPDTLAIGVVSALSTQEKITAVRA